jgi:hypothetical protein
VEAAAYRDLVLAIVWRTDKKLGFKVLPDGGSSSEPSAG